MNTKIITLTALLFVQIMSGQCNLISYETTEKFITENLNLGEEFSMDENGNIIINQHNSDEPEKFNITKMTDVSEITLEGTATDKNCKIKFGNLYELYFNCNKDNPRILTAFKNYWLVVQQSQNEKKLIKQHTLFDEEKTKDNKPQVPAAPPAEGGQ
ncbi:hypothetical protein KIH23_13350 [Flavobacterium sp. CYK-55]|uniref:hypothetical protein n=1 Tax=Flavobacterium sp. CYK-55 TaxID=2835529 RepID=UPI001BD1BA7E|nr:hypothetical protein [Flavobacterium sp. CYK-55]MBS7788288.1 hypothetical protein [Flavobacterium sp. CYK-55]